MWVVPHSPLLANMRNVAPQLPHHNSFFMREDELPFDKFDERFADFMEPGGEFELDMDKVGELVEEYRSAETRWAKENFRALNGGVLIPAYIFPCVLLRVAFSLRQRPQIRPPSGAETRYRSYRGRVCKR